MSVTPSHLPFTLISFLPPPSQDITLICHSPKVLDLELKYYRFLEVVQSRNLTPVPSNAASLAAFYYMQKSYICKCKRYQLLRLLFFSVGSHSTKEDAQRTIGSEFGCVALEFRGSTSEVKVPVTCMAIMQQQFKGLCFLSGCQQTDTTLCCSSLVEVSNGSQRKTLHYAAVQLN